MIFCYRPCWGRARWRRRHISRTAANLLIALGCLAAFVGLLFLAPQWVLVITIIALLIAILFLIKH